MAESIDESVSVNLLSNHMTHSASPSSLYWHGRRYTLTHIGLHHTVQEGRTLIHIFSATDGVTFFKLKFDTETLEWRLLEIETN